MAAVQVLEELPEKLARRIISESPIIFNDGFQKLPPHIKHMTIAQEFPEVVKESSLIVNCTQYATSTVVGALETLSSLSAPRSLSLQNFSLSDYQQRPDCSTLVSAIQKSIQKVPELSFQECRLSCSHLKTIVDLQPTMSTLPADGGGLTSLSFDSIKILDQSRHAPVQFWNTIIPFIKQQSSSLRSLSLVSLPDIPPRARSLYFSPLSLLVRLTHLKLDSPSLANDDLVRGEKFPELVSLDLSYTAPEGELVFSEVELLSKLSSFTCLESLRLQRSPGPVESTFILKNTSRGSTFYSSLFAPEHFLHLTGLSSLHICGHLGFLPLEHAATVTLLLNNLSLLCSLSLRFQGRSGTADFIDHLELHDSLTFLDLQFEFLPAACTEALFRMLVNDLVELDTLHLDLGQPEWSDSSFEHSLVDRDAHIDLPLRSCAIKGSSFFPRVMRMILILLARCEELDVFHISSSFLGKQRRELEELLFDLPDSLNVLTLESVKLPVGSAKRIAEGLSEHELVEKVELIDAFSISKGLPALKAFCPALAQLPTLFVLKIEQKGSSLSNEVAGALSNALGSLSVLEELTLIGCHIDEHAAKALAPGLGKLSELLQLSIVGCGLNAGGIFHLAPSVSQLTRLQKLDMSDNAMLPNDVGLAVLLESLVDLPFLYSVALKGSAIFGEERLDGPSDEAVLDSCAHRGQSIGCLAFFLQSTRSVRHVVLDVPHLSTLMSKLVLDTLSADDPLRCCSLADVCSG